jgi:hypothetical protein
VADLHRQGSNLQPCDPKSHTVSDLILTFVTRSAVCRQAPGNIVESVSKDHDGSEKGREEHNKCPRYEDAWTLFEIRYPILAGSYFSTDLHA